MASYKDLIVGLKIFERHDPGGHLPGAEHDVVYGSEVPPESMTKDELAELDAAGWRWYANDRSWQRYV